MSKKFDCHCSEDPVFFDGVFCANCGSWDGYSFDRVMKPKLKPIIAKFAVSVCKALADEGFKDPKILKKAHNRIIEFLSKDYGDFFDVIGMAVTPSKRGHK